MNFKKLLSKVTLRTSWFSHERVLYLFLMLWICLGLKILHETVQRELLKKCFTETAVVKRHTSMKFNRNMKFHSMKKGKRCSEEKLSINALVLNSVQSVACFEPCQTPKSNVLQKWLTAKSRNYLGKTLHLRYLTGFKSSFFVKKITHCKPLTVLIRKLHHRCLIQS